MNKFLKFLDTTISIILEFLVGFLAVGVGVTVILRYFLGISFSMLEEFLTMSFIFITLFGSAIAIRERQHIAIAFLADRVVGKSRQKRVVSTILVDGAILFVCGVLLRYSCVWISKVGHLLSQNSHLPMGVFYIFMPITFALTIFYAVVDILSLFVPIEDADGGYKTDDVLPEDAS